MLSPFFRRVSPVNYRRLGRSGLKVSELSLGSWVTYGNQLDAGAARECMAAAWDRGVNFFDNAEVYANGKSEEIMGEALKKLAWPRLKYVVSTKFFWGITDGPNEKATLNRKYLMDAIDGSLKRLQLDYVDLAYCHRPDANTPIEETVWAMHDMIERGKALYWGTSEWSAVEIELGSSLAQLAIAWCARNPNVSTVITGASRVSQVEENLKAADVIAKLTPALMERIDELTATLAG